MAGGPGAAAYCGAAKSALTQFFEVLAAGIGLADVHSYTKAYPAFSIRPSKTTPWAGCNVAKTSPFHGSGGHAQTRQVDGRALIDTACAAQTLVILPEPYRTLRRACSGVRRLRCICAR